MRRYFVVFIAIFLVIALFFFLRLAIFSPSGYNYSKKIRDFGELNIPDRITANDLMPIKEFNSEKDYAFLYYGNDGGLYYYNSKNGNMLLNGEFLTKYGPHFSWIDYELQGSELYVVHWVRKPPDKKVILLKLKEDGSKESSHVFSETNQAFGKPKIVGDSKGGLLVVWADESQGYGVSYTLSRDGGKNFEAETILRPAIIAFDQETYSPYYDPKEGFMIVYTTPKDIRVKRLRDGQEKVLFSFEKEGPQNTNVYILGKRNFLEVYVWSFSSVDPYSSYKLTHLTYINPMEEPVSKKETIYNRGTPNIMPVYGAKYPIFFTIALPPKEEKQDKETDIHDKLLAKRINVVYSWNGKDYDRVTPKDDFNDYTYAQLQSDYSLAKNGELLVSYFDKRYILPQIWVSYLKDGKVVAYGPLEEPWTVTSVFSKTVHLKDDIYRVYYFVVQEDGRSVLRARDIIAGELNNPFKIPSLSERKKRLQEDINKFAECQVKNDLGCIYSYFDPVGQRQYPFSIFQQNAERLKVEIKDYKCKGEVLKDSNVAWVECKYTYKLPPQLMGISIKEKDRLRNDSMAGYWVFIKDRWRWVIETFPGVRALDW